jgi:hypothetical protein
MNGMQMLRQAAAAAAAGGGGGPPVDTGPLAAYKAGIWCICDPLRLIVSTYTGPLLRVRRSSDNAERDIYPLAGAIDIGDISTWGGVDSVYVAKVYDQNGSNDFAQATTVKQPRVANAGIYDGCLVWDGSDDCLQSVNNSGGAAAHSVFIKRSIVGSTTQVMIELTTDTGSVSGENGLAFYSGASGTKPSTILYSTGTTYGATENSSNVSNAVYGVVGDKSESTIALKGRLFLDSGELTPPTSTFNSGTPTGSFSAAKWNWGARNNGASSPAFMNGFCLVIYEANKASDAVAICAALN